MDGVYTSPSATHASTATLRRVSKPGDNGPPPPPRRAPTTKLTHSNGVSRSRSSSTTSFHGDRPPALSFAVEARQADEVTSFVGDSSTDDELPTVPPPLPLYNPQTSVQNQVFNPNDMGLPAPPPPDVLLFDTMKRLESQHRRANCDQDQCDFPPPPPTL